MIQSFYLCAPWRRWAEAVWLRNGLLPLRCTSSWIDSARTVDGPEGLERMSEDDIRRIRCRNDADLDAAQIVVVQAFHGEGGEMFCEVARAEHACKPIVWVGERLILTAMGPRVIRVATPLEAISIVRDMARGKRVA